MPREHKRSTKLAQSRRRNHVEEDDVENNEAGPAIIDDSASDANSDDDLQLSRSDNDDDEEEDEEQDLNSDQKKKEVFTKEPLSQPTSESYDRLGDGSLQGSGFVDSMASNRSSKLKKANDTAIMMNGFKDIPGEDDGSAHEEAIQFDELDDTISFAPRPTSAKTSSTARVRATPLSTRRGAARERPDRETYWQRRNREREEYKKRLEDPTFTPYVGEFFMHDSRKKRQFDSLNHALGPRGKGRGRGFKGTHRDTTGKSDSQPEESWGHDGFEELEPLQSLRGGSSKGKARSQTSSFGRQTPQSDNHQAVNASSSASNNDPVKSQELKPNPSRPTKNHTVNITPLTSTHISINISFPNTKPVAKDIVLNSYVGRVPYQKALRGDRPVKISSIEGAKNREIFPSKERSWLPYFLKNTANASQVREGDSQNGGNAVSTVPPNDAQPGRHADDTPSKIPLSAVHAPVFTPRSPTPGADDDDDKPTKIRVNLPTLNTTTSASPAASDSSSLQVHHPRPTKHINIADIDDSSARLKAFLNPQTSSSPSHSHERTSSTQIPETAVHAPPFRPSNFVPAQPQHQQIPNPFNPPVPYYYPTYTPLSTDYPPSTSQNPYIIPQPRYEGNGPVFYFDPSFYYFHPPVAQPGPPSSQQPQSQQQPSEQSNTSSPSTGQQIFYYHPSQLPDPQHAQSMGMYFPYPQGS